MPRSRWSDDFFLDLEEDQSFGYVTNRGPVHPGREIVVRNEDLLVGGSAVRIPPPNRNIPRLPDVPAVIDHRRKIRMTQLVDPKKIRERIHADLARLAEAEALATRFPAEPPIGSILRFERKFARSDVAYQYVAFRAPNGAWYLTGQSLDNMTPSWVELRDLISNEPCDMAMTWNEIPVNEPEAVDQVTDPAKWWELVWGQKAPETGNGGQVIDAPSA